MSRGGAFEEATRRKLVAAMIKHYAENDEEPAQIKAIYVVKKNGKPDEFCADFVSKMQDVVDEGVAEWRKIADQEYRGQKEIEREFRAGLL